MCGILGILDTRGRLNPVIFEGPNASQVLKHRGPDDEGHFVDSFVYLGQRRLSIIDLSSGKQPIFNEDRTKCVIFNGEIYNFQELRTDLERRGHRFTTKSDTEVIIHAYEEWGKNCVERFRGMFAFAIWDSADRKLFIARDRLGIKPLFYAVLGNIFYFASEMKAILQYPSFPRVMDPDGVAAYFMLSYIPAPLTIYKHIRKLQPGHILEVKNGEIEISKYWDLYFQPDRSRSEKYFIDGFMEILEEAVKLRMISDVPLGAFLSGGIDSGTVVALMSKLNPDPVRTFSIGFGGDVGGYLDERGYAREVATMYQTMHSEHEIIPEFRDIVEDISKSFDEPFADASIIPTYYVSKIARQKVKVALSGLGGDELFGGYERYLGFKFSNLYNKFPYFLREKIISQVVQNIPERVDGHYTVNHLKRFVRSASLPQDTRYIGFLSMLDRDARETLFSQPGTYAESFIRCEDMLLRYLNAPNAKEPLDRVFYCDIKTYLPEDILACTDRMSMWNSLEVRVPFLDHKLMEFCATIPSELKINRWVKKHILKKAVDNILPRSVISHRKQGFVGPMAYWLRNELKPQVLDMLSEKNLNRHGMFNNKTVKSLLDQHFHRVEIHDKFIWSLLMFQTWYNLYVESKFPTCSQYTKFPALP